MQFRGRYYSEFGRTILEMISVLLIMGVISVTAMIWWSKAVNTQKANAILEEIGKRASVVQANNIIDGQEQHKRGVFTTNLYDGEDYKTMSYGFGVSAPKFQERDEPGGKIRRIKISIGKLEKGKELNPMGGGEEVTTYYNPVPEATCKMLLEREGSMTATDASGKAQTANMVYEWEMLDKNGKKVKDCAQQTVMIAWMNKTASASFAAQTAAVAKTCTRHTDCPANWECNYQSHCQICVRGHVRRVGEDKPCYMGCSMRKSSLVGDDQDCLICNPADDSSLTWGNNTPCGPKPYGLCKLQADDTSKCH